MKSWASEYTNDEKPTLAQIQAFVGGSLWADLTAYLEQTHGGQPFVEYSMCSGQPGWNVKYKKSGKSLATLYPMDGYFIALVTVGPRQYDSADLLLPGLSPYIQQLYQRSKGTAYGKWMMVEVTSPTTLADIQRLVDMKMQK